MAMDVVHQATRQLGKAVELESNVNQPRETNMCLLTENVTDQKMVIDLQTRMVEKKDLELSSFQETVQKKVKS